MAITLLQLQNGSKGFGSRKLFEGASFAINEGEHVGVIGPNGAGKTTLFKILAEQEYLDEGQITRSQQLRLGYLEQEADWNLEEIVEDYLANNCLKPIWDLKQLGLKLGLTENHFRSRLTELSGGYRMRVKLLFLIGQEPNLLLLDEPTNFLDLETLLVFESFLQDFAGAFLMISHDREFLRRTTDHIVEVEAGDITKYPGNLDDYFEQKALLREILQKQMLNQEAKKKSVMDFVTRFGAKATKAKQAQSKLRSLEKMEKIEIKDLPLRASIHIPEPVKTGKEILSLAKADCGYAGRKILNNVELRLERGKHLGIVGLNGAGKSTLLKSLGEQIPLIAGDLKYGLNVTLAYFSQHSADQLNPEWTVLEALNFGAHSSVLQQEVLNIAGSLLFAGEAVQKKVKVLSGGEKSRVALGQILLKKAPLLLLDEPTNHLDFDTVEALTEALARYEGSIVTVSHDRAFISRVANQILEIRNAQLLLYPGSYDEYVWSLQKGYLSELESSVAANSPSAKTRADEISVEPSKFNYKEERKKLETAIKKHQKELSDIEKKLVELAGKQVEMTEKLMTLTGPQAQTLSKELHGLSSEILSLEERMLLIMEEQDQAQKKLLELTGN
ncbi:ATP-binding cassette domain-containing protein [Bdellovibrio sp. HCB337]|uniref:ATP-binding cassette domain-containing protein n=1 Tax=Bdellovibrio sp. HCB337 TaxID=3394358 RepID=UPI0039A5E197